MRRTCWKANADVLRKCWEEGLNTVEAGHACGYSHVTAWKYYKEFAKAGPQPRPPSEPSTTTQFRALRGPMNSASFRIPPAVFEDQADRKLVEHQSLTAALMGDPLPGRSALDCLRLTPRKGPSHVV